MTPEKEETMAETAEERRLNRNTAEAISYLFASPNDVEEFDFEDFLAAVNEKSTNVELTFIGERGTSSVPGNIFVEWVWELLANA